MKDVLARLTRRAGWTEGDVWTIAVGLTVATALAVSTIPAVWEHRDGRTLSARRSASPTPAPPPVVVPGPSPTPATPGLAPLAPPAAGEPFPAPSQGEERPAPPRRPVPVVLRGLVSLFAALPIDGSPGGLAVAPDGSVLAGTDAPGSSKGPASLVRWSSDGALGLRTPVPGQPADRTRGLTGLDHSSDARVLAADAATGRVLRYDGDRWSALLSVPDVPICLGPVVTPCQPGLTDTAPLLRGLAVAPTGDVFVSDAGQGTIWRLRDGASAPEAWYQSEDVLGAESLAGAAVATDGAVLVAVSRFSGLQATGAGALLRIARNADGTAGTRTTVAGFAAGEDVVDVAVGSSQLYVALRGADAVAVLDPDGAESLRFTSDRLVRPTAVAVAQGRLLLTTSGARGAVLQVGVEDGPAD